MNYDIETINFKELNKYPNFKCPSSYSLQRESGNGCFLDPPGYPTYFTRSVYTKYGNTPSKGAQLVLFGAIIKSSSDWNSCKDWNEYQAKIEKRMRNLYIPLPVDHIRVRGWIVELYNYFHNCYQDDTIDKSSSVDKLIIYPIPYYELKSFKDDERFSEEWREKAKAEVEQYNKELIEKVKKIAIPENHRAVRVIKEWYPDYEPEIELIENPPKKVGNWWERYSKKPTPEECPGQYGTKHPVNGSWCQMCGWHE